MAGPELQVEITWRPFELNPEMPKEGAGPQRISLEKIWLVGAFAISRCAGGARGGRGWQD